MERFLRKRQAAPLPECFALTPSEDWTGTDLEVDLQSIMDDEDGFATAVVTGADPDVGVASAADTDVGVASATDTEVGVASAAGPDVGVASAAHPKPGLASVPPAAFQEGQLEVWDHHDNMTNLMQGLFQAPICSRCGMECELTRSQDRGTKSGGTWKCKPCNSKGVFLSRSCGGFPTPEFKSPHCR